jgi:hypothetical protein
VDTADDLRLRQSEQVVIALLVAAVFMKSIAVVMMGVQSMALDHGAHRAVEHEYSLGEKVVQKLNALVAHALVEIKMKNPSAGAGRVCHALAAFIKRPQAECQIGAVTR